MAGAARDSGVDAEPPSLRLKRAVLMAFVIVVAAKAVFAAGTGLYLDEAFYWQCGQRLDIAYSDHPFVTALLVRAGTEIAGDTHLGVRILFLVLGAALPPLVWHLARPLVGERRAWMAAGLSFTAPVLAITGMVAVPDVALALLAAGGIAAFERATRPLAPGDPPRWAAWAATGVLAALGFCTHYRFVVVVFAAAVYLVATRQGRLHLRRPGPWLAAGVASLGLIPVLVFNARHDFAPLRYQFVERHTEPGKGPLAWLLHLGEQMVVVSPLLYVAFVAALVATWRARSLRVEVGRDRRVLLATFATVPLVTYFLASPFAGDSFAHFHWPGLGYIPLCVLVPGWLDALAGRGGWRRAFAVGAPATAAVLTAAFLVGVTTDLFSLRTRLRAFAGWPEVATATRERLLADPAGARPIVVADSTIQAAQIDFELGGTAEVFTLDHPRNRGYGRALQYAIWGLDEAGLTARAGRDALIVLESSDYGRKSFASWTKHAATRFERVEAVGSVSIPAWRKPRVMVFLAGRGVQP